MIKCLVCLSSILLLGHCRLVAQQSNLADLVEKLDETGQVDLAQSKVRLIKADYQFENKNVECIITRPFDDGPFPGLLLIPGYSKTARDYIPLAMRFAAEGFAVITIAQPGFGRSEGPADFVGPGTIKTMQAGLENFRKQKYVDTDNIGVLGYSRGAMAASLLATSGVNIHAGVFAAGIYDLKKAHDEIEIEGIKENIKKETGGTATALDVRSSMKSMAKLKCPVLILHGAKDINAPVSQAYDLRDKLKIENKQFEIKIFDDSAHSIGMKNLVDHSMSFFVKHLKN